MGTSRLRPYAGGRVEPHLTPTASGTLTDASRRLELDADDQVLAVRFRDPLAMIIHDESDVVKAHRWSFVLQEAVSD